MSAVPSTTSTTTTPANGAAATSSGNAALADAKNQKDQFLQILLTQLKNQNPSDPMKPEEFASQLAQFSALEQQIDTNTKLDSLISATASNVSPVSYLGTAVDYSSNIAPVQSEAATWTYSTTGASTVNLVIKDATGNTVYTGTGDATAGAHTMTLNSLAGVPDGTPLTMTVTAADATGATVTPTVTSRATITAVDTLNGTTNLEASGYQIPSASVSRIAVPAVASSTSNSSTSS